MNEITTKTEKTMTTKELAKVLGVDVKTIKRTVEKLGIDINVLPLQTKGGIQNTVVFTEAQATAIKIELQNHSKVAKNGFDTLSISNELEFLELQKRLEIYRENKIQELRELNKKQQLQLLEQQPKVEYYDDFIEQGGNTSFRKTAKELGINEKKFISFLIFNNYIYRDSSNKLQPYSEKIECGYFVVKDWVKGNLTGTQTLITPKGKQKIQSLISK